MGSPPTLDPTGTQRPDLDRQIRDGHKELLEHLQTPAAWGGHEFGNWPVHDIANGFGGDLHARHRHDHTRLPTSSPTPTPNSPGMQSGTASELSTG
jgi:hypothetical protein